MSTNISPERKVVNQAQFATYWQATQQSLSLAEKTANKVDEISADSTRAQYPSAKAVYDFNQTTRVAESGEDLNNYKTAGTYYFESSVTPTNLPEDGDAGVNGFLYVVTSQQHTTNQAVVKQYWHRFGTPSSHNDAHIWSRGYSDTAGWGTWVRIITNTSRNGKYASQFADNYQMPTFTNLVNNEELCIPLDADLDNYVIPGTFIATSNTISGSLNNCPFTQGGFRLFVSLINNSQIAQQILIGHSAESQIFLRQINMDGTWGSWKKIIAEPTGVVQIANGGTGATTADGAKSALGLASFTSISYSSSSNLLTSLKTAWANIPVAQSFNICMQSVNSVRSSVYGIKKDADNGHMICLLIGSSSDDSDIIQYVVSSGTWTRTDFVVS